MPLARRLARGLAALFHPARADAEVDEELRHYADQAAAAHRAAGLAPDDARRAAALEMGSAVALREEVRASGWEHVLETTLQDTRYALRRLRRDPAFTLTAILTLALGIGAATAVFSAVNPVLLEPLPFPRAGRLVTLDDRNAAGNAAPATLGTYDELVARTHSFEALAAADWWRPSLTGTGDPEQLRGARVTAGYFGVFGAVPLVGRGFSAADDRPGAPKVAVVSEGLAVRRFGGARAVVGRTIELDGDPYLVVGVMPPAFVNVLEPAVTIWAPLGERASGDFGTREWGHHYHLVARLAPGATPESAAREVLAMARAPSPDFPRPRWADLSRGLTIRPLQDAVTASARPALFAVALAVLLLLAIAAVNVANLLLARGALRRAELAMWVALGAGRRRIVRQLLTESVTLALLGGMAGLGVAAVGVRVLVAVSPPGLPRVDAIRLDARVFLFAVLLTALVGVLLGLAPAFAALRGEGTESLQRDSRRTTTGRSRARGALVVVEVALALVLLVSAGLLLRSVRRLLAVAPGFDPAHVVTMQVIEAGHGFDQDAARLAFWQQALDAVRHVPGVESAGLTSQLPLSGEVDGYGWEAEGMQATAPGAGDNGSVLRYAVSPGYLATLRIPLIRGRLLGDGDRPGGPEAVLVSERFARQLFGTADPLGKRIRVGPEIGSGRAWDEIVGVVGDVRHYSLAVGPPNAFYVANGQWDWVDNTETLVVRAAGRTAALVPSLERAVRSVDRNVPILRVEPMESFVAASAGNRRFALLAIETFALAALLLAGVGLYGVISGSVTERIREIGIRAALGATPGDVVRQVVRRSLALTLGGAGLGVVGAIAATRLLASMLFGVSALDPVTYGGVLAVLVGVAVVAAWAPARRAVGVDPTVALRAE